MFEKATCNISLQKYLKESNSEVEAFGYILLLLLPWLRPRMYGGRKGEEVVCLHLIFPIVFTKRKAFFFPLSAAEKNNPR